MTDEPRRTALVTGASTGIGRAFAEHLASQGLDLVLTARRLDVLGKVAAEIQDRFEVDCRVIPADLAEPDAPRRIYYELARDEIHVDVLVNNAGYGLPESLLETDWPDVRDFLEVMAVSWLHFIRLFTPGMVEQGWGRIANVASLAAFAPEPPASLYSGVKSQMVMSSRGIRRKLLGTGVHCTAVCPGFTHSEFHERLGMPDVASTMPRWMWQDAQDVVAEGWRACERNRAVVLTGTPNKLIRGFLAVVPTALAERLTPRSIKEVRGRRRRATVGEPSGGAA